MFVTRGGREGCIPLGFVAHRGLSSHRVVVIIIVVGGLLCGKPSVCQTFFPINVPHLTLIKLILGLHVAIAAWIVLVALFTLVERLYLQFNLEVRLLDEINDRLLRGMPHIFAVQ